MLSGHHGLAGQPVPLPVLVVLKPGTGLVTGPQVSMVTIVQGTWRNPSLVIVDCVQVRYLCNGFFRGKH